MTTIVSLHAHPDDEALLTGGWIAQRAVGRRSGRPGLRHRRRRRAGRLPVLRRWRSTGCVVARPRPRRRRWGSSASSGSGYADSGIADQPTRASRRFVDVPVDEAARRVAGVLDQEDAEHPHRVRRQRRLRASRPPTRAPGRPPRPGARLDASAAAGGDAGPHLAGPAAAGAPCGRAAPAGADRPSGAGLHRAGAVSLVVDVRPQLGAKRAALAAHASQRPAACAPSGCCSRCDRSSPGGCSAPSGSSRSSRKTRCRVDAVPGHDGRRSVRTWKMCQSPAVSTGSYSPSQHPLGE